MKKKNKKISIPKELIIYFDKTPHELLMELGEIKAIEITKKLNLLHEN